MVAGADSRRRPRRASSSRRWTSCRWRTRLFAIVRVNAIVTTISHMIMNIIITTTTTTLVLLLLLLLLLLLRLITMMTMIMQLNSAYADTFLQDAVETCACVAAMLRKGMGDSSVVLLSCFVLSNKQQKAKHTETKTARTHNTVFSPPGRAWEAPAGCS